MNKDDADFFVHSAEGKIIIKPASWRTRSSHTSIYAQRSGIVHHYGFQIPTRDDFVVVDLETTGGSPHVGAAITEIGAVKVRGGVVIGEFKSFVNPLAPIPLYITELTGIDNEMVRLAPVIDEVFPSFLEFCGSETETVLVAHNAPFDIGFLRAASRELEYQWPKFKVVDTVRLARSVLTRDEVMDCKLGTLAIFFNTQATPNHRALDDAQTTVEVLHSLIERLGGFGVQTFGELERFLRKRIKREPRLI